jgi:poly(beta-D-mannuronate) lyase
MKHLKRHSIMILAVISGLLLFNHTTSATEYTVSSDDEFEALTLVAGDMVTWLDGTYSDQQINWKGQEGTESAPIILKAETPGGVIFTGDSRINFFGSHLIVDGFYWKGGEGASNHIEFRKNGSNSDFGFNCTIRNCAFDNLVTPEPDKSRWIVLYGSGNVVENCSFINKLSAGALILVELDYSEGITPGHIIRKNYFFNITPKDAFSTNSGDCEAIRIGVSSDQSVSAQVLVEGNYFQAADGENEIITSKSADNTYLHNTFRNCRGSLVLRHGAGAHIEGNFFLGEGKAKSGGIRVSDRDHVIINNYMQGLSNDNDIWNNGITLVGGGESSGGSGNGYQNVDNVTIVHNTIYDSDDPIFFNDRNSYDPTGTIAFNLIYSENGNIVAGDISGTGQGMTYEGNIFGGSPIGISDNGITEGDADFSASGETFKPSSTGIAANAAGSAYSSIVNIDVEGITRPNSDLDVGAHEVSGGGGSVVYFPITDADVGAGVGACFLDAAGNVLPECGAVGDYLTVSQVSDFTDVGSTKSVSVSSNVDWTVSDDQDWISVSPTSGTGSGSIDITVTSNAATSERAGTVTVSGSGVDNRTISITQAGYVAPIDVTGVSLTPVTAVVAVGGTQQFTVSISPSDATNQDVSFRSDNEAIATVSASGLVTTVAEGTATITVTTDDGGFTAASVITATAPSTEFNWALNQPVSATGTPDGDNIEANLVDGDVVSRWSVSGFPQSATIDLGAVITINQMEVVCYDDRAYQYIIEGSLSENGTYTTIVDRSDNTTPGAANVPIIDVIEDIDARYVKVTVSGADQYTGEWVSLTEFRVFGEGERAIVSVTGVSLNQSNFELDEDETQQLTATVNPSNATDTGVSYSSSNSSIFTVDGDGLVTAVSEGMATVTVTTNDGSFTDSIGITVISPEPVLSVTNDLTTIYPNPASNYILLPKNLQGSYSILDTSGRKIISGFLNNHQIDISLLKEGVYFIDVSEHRFRFIKD